MYKNTFNKFLSDTELKAYMQSIKDRKKRGNAERQAVKDRIHERVEQIKLDKELDYEF